MEGPLEFVPERSDSSSFRLSRRNVRASVTDLLQGSTKRFYCFLFNDVIVFTKEKKEYYTFRSIHDLKDLEVAAKSEETLFQMKFTPPDATSKVFVLSTIT